MALCSLAFPSSALEAPEALAALVWRVVTNAASIIHRGARGQCYTISLCESFFVCEIYSDSEKYPQAVAGRPWRDNA